MASGNIKGITIEIGGNVAPLNKALANVNTESKNIQQELKAVNTLLKFDPSNTEALEKKQKLLQAALSASKDKLDVLKQAQAQVEAQFHAGDMGEAEYKAFQNRVTYAEADVKKAEKAVDDFGKELEESGKEAKGAGENSEKAGKQAKQSGDDAKNGGNGWETFGKLASSAGKIAVAGVTAIGAGAAATGKAVWSMAQDVADAGGDIDDAAKKVGTSAEEYQKWAYAAKLGGMETAKLEALMVKQQKAFSDAQEGSKTTAEAYKRLGVDIASIGNSGDAFNVVIAKLADMEDETTRNALANDIFGKSYADLAPLLAEGSKGIEEWKQECEDLGGVMSGTAVEAGAEFGDSLDRLKTAFSGVKNSIMANMLPGLTQLTSGFTDLIAGQEGAGKSIKAGVDMMLQSFQEAVPQLVTVLQTITETIIGIAPEIITTLVTVLLGCLPTLIDTLFQILQGLLNSITSNVQMIVDVIMQLITTVIQFIVMNLPLFVDAGLKIIVALINGIATALPQIIQAIVDMIPKLIQAITDNLPLIIGAGITLLLSLTQGLIDAIPQLLEALPTIISALLDGILSAIPQLIDAGIQLLTALVTALPTIIAKIVEVLPQIVTSIITALMNNLPLLIEAGIKLFLALITAMPTIIIEIVKAIPQIVSGLVNGIIKSIPQMIEAGKQLLISIPKKIPEVISYTVTKIGGLLKGAKDAVLNFIPQMADAGLNLIKGLWNGIKDAGAWLWDKISGFFGGIVDKIKGFFGIHSPSTLFRDMIGKNLVKGISVGVDVETPNLQKDIEDNMGSVTAGLKTTLDMESAKLNIEQNAPSGVNLGGLHFEIGTFVNNTERDLQQLVEEGMEVAEEYIRRRGGVFA